MYKIIICTANISHKSWWNGKPSYKFDSFAEVVRCLKEIFPPNSIREWEFARMAKCDAETENGRIACTSWYEIIKGERPMTEYTFL